MYPYSDLKSKDELSLLSIKNEAIDEIIRGEISAVEAYDQVMEKINEYPEFYELKAIKREHENAVQFWRKEAKDLGKVPERNSGFWGTTVAAIVETSKLISEELALSTIKKGEEHGLADYKKMLSNRELTIFQKNEIKDVFIPMQERHIKSIDTLIQLQ